MPDAGSLHSDVVASLTRLYDYTRQQEVGSYAQIISALQRTAVEYDLVDESEFGAEYDQGYVEGLNRAADIVQIIAHGGKPAADGPDFLEWLRNRASA